MLVSPGQGAVSELILGTKANTWNLLQLSPLIYLNLCVYLLVGFLHYFVCFQLKENENKKDTLLCSFFLRVYKDNIFS